MSHLQYVGDAAGCGGCVDPNIVFIPLPCTQPCCFSTLPQSEPNIPQPKTRTPYDDLVDSFVQSNIEALEKSKYTKYPKEDHYTAVRQPILEHSTARKQLEPEKCPVKKQLDKPPVKSVVDPVSSTVTSELTNNEDKKSANSLKSKSWASKYMQKIGQLDPKAIKINLMTKKPTQREVDTTPSSAMKTAKNVQIDNSQKMNNKTNMIEIFAPIRPKLNFVIPKLNQPKKDSSAVIDGLKCKNNSNKEVTKKKNITTVPPRTNTKLPKIPISICQQVRKEHNLPPRKEKTIKTENTTPFKDKYCEEKVDIVSNSKFNRVLSSSSSKNYITKDNEIKKSIKVEDKQKTKEKSVKITSIPRKSNIELKKKSNPTKDLARAKSKHDIKSSQHVDNAIKNIIKDNKAQKVKYLNTKNKSPEREKYGYISKKNSLSKKNELQNLRLKKIAHCENISDTFTEDEDDVFDLRQKLNKKEIYKKLKEYKTSQKAFKQYLQQKKIDNSRDNNIKNIASAFTFDTTIKPKEPSVREIKLVIKIIDERRPDRPTADEPSIKVETNDDLDFLEDFNVDEVVNCLNECEDKSYRIEVNQNSNTKISTTDVNDNIEEKMEMLFNESPVDSLEQTISSDVKSEISKEVTLINNVSVSKEIGVDDLVKESIVKDSHANLLSDVKITTEIKLNEDTRVVEANYIDKKEGHYDATKNLPFSLEDPVTAINCENNVGTSVITNSFLPAVDSSNINTLQLVNTSDAELGNKIDVTQPGQNKDNVILACTTINEEKIISPEDDKTDCESIKISLPKTKFNQSLKENNNKTGITEEPNNFIDEPEIDIQILPKEEKMDSIQKIQVKSPVKVKILSSDEINAVKIKDENKTLKRKINFQEPVKDSKNLNNLNSDVSDTSYLRCNEIILIKSLQGRMKRFLGKNLTIDSVIHRGKFSIIFKCKNSENTQYAVKVTHNHCPLAINQEKMIKGFQKDIPKESLNCVYLINGFGLHRRSVLMMEFYPHNLQQYFLEKNKSLRVNHLQNLARQLVGAVITLRNCNIVHSDIKPSHILLNAAGNQLKLCGFDSAYYVTPQALFPNIGTVNYRAPEIIIGYGASFSIDVWSTAVVMYEMATGYQLFPGAYNNDILFKQMSTLGSIPFDMLLHSTHSSLYFRGSIFLRKVGYMGEKTMPIHSFQKSSRLSSTIFKEYAKDWGHSVPISQQVKETSKLRSLIKLLEQMLIIDPRHRLAIEFVFANSFIHETFH